ncbi:RNA polymerase sigma factor [Elizabethkingia meningoseptica]|uniref:RNA polymerase sigma factor n=1 Tax=Elizabethkingia meningoseptica TaxID=238 RepID=UPI0023B0B4AE|nr:RNA polymerase sigma factor [Elizabethkingia meningoseptica]MDE5526881.1 RNA polymerase sigma factor [Elizabethkingia meningoseptica]
MNEEILQQCIRNNRIAQRKLYDAYYPKLHFVCKRYLKSQEDIEEVLADAFFSIFSKLSQLKEWQAFDAWSRRITVNQCLSFLRKKELNAISIDEFELNLPEPVIQDFPYNEEELLQLLDTLPTGTKTIFNLYAIEGYSHKEIAEQLGISEGTSKSQLNFAKSKLQKLVHQFYFSKTN